MNSIANSRNVFLDLIFTTFNNITVSLPVDLLFESNIHHSPVTFDILTYEDVSHLKFEEYYYDFKNGNYQALNDFLQVLIGIHYSII